MGGGTETMYNQITFIFSRKYRGNILSMHLTRNKNKNKNKKLKFVNENYSYCPEAIIFQN